MRRNGKAVKWVFGALLSLPAGGLLGCGRQPPPAPAASERAPSPGAVRGPQPLPPVVAVIEPPTLPPSLPPPAVSRPDYVITDVKVEPKPQVVAGRAVLVRGTMYTLRVEVSNQGPGDSRDPIGVSFDYGCRGPGVGMQGDRASTGEALPAGTKRLCTPLTFHLPASVPHGTCTFKFKVDPGDAVAEESETNNEREVTVTIH